MMIGWRGRRAPAKHDGPAGSGDVANPDGRTGARLRRMVSADLADVMALEHELFPDDPWTDEMFTEEVTQPPGSRLYLVAEAEADAARAGEPVVAGYAGMMFVSRGDQADVLTIAVAQSFWGQGIGSALLGALIKAARDRGCTEVFLEVREDNPRARGLYLRRGFEEIGVRRGYYQPSGVDAVVMRKDLRR
jgi:[ribosomal protein S18]-alanine N-acetyltransferase